MNSLDTNHTFNDNKKSWPIWLKCNTIPDHAMLQLSCKSDEYEEVGQYGPYVILSGSSDAM